MSLRVDEKSNIGPSVDVVAFDFDHTLTVRDSVIPFVVDVAGTWRVFGAVVRTLPTVLGFVWRRDNDALKEHFSRHCLAGLRDDEVGHAGVRHAERIVSSRMRLDVCTRLRAHQDRGDVVIIVSASFGPYMHVVGDLLEVDAVLCTELESDGGVLTGRLVMGNCRGEEKARRITAWLDSSGLSRDSLRVAYGDSSGDDQMLEMARVPIRIGNDDLDDNDFTVDTGPERVETPC